MTISLGGAPGRKTGGQTQIGGQAVQAPRPPEPVEAGPAAARAEGAGDEPARIRASRAAAAAEASPAGSDGKNVNTGEVPREGSTRVDTRVRGQGFGLSRPAATAPARR